MYLIKCGVCHKEVEWDWYDSHLEKHKKDVLDRASECHTESDGIKIIKPIPAPLNIRHFERETDELMEGCCEGEVPSYIGLYNYLFEVKRAIAELKRAGWKKIYIKPDMFPMGKEPNIIHEDDRGTYYYEEEKSNA